MNNASLKVLDLFSGIGGFSLGLERAGMQTMAFCEIDKFCQKILKKHWPGTLVWSDIKTLTKEKLWEAYRTNVKENQIRNYEVMNETVDVICGGYPCQPFSVAGQRKGTEDDRHLWPEMFRLIREIRPSWIICENVAGHVSMGLDEVLSDLESENYTCWPFIIPACAVNAPHRRNRVWIIANYESRSNGSHKTRTQKRQEQKPREGFIGNAMADTEDWMPPPKQRSNRKTVCNSKKGQDETGKFTGVCSYKALAYSDNERLQKFDIPTKPNDKKYITRRGDAANAANTFSKHDDNTGHRTSEIFRQRSEEAAILDNQKEWLTQSPVCGPDDGISHRVARLKALGNAVVPQIPEIIGRMILNAQ